MKKLIRQLFLQITAYKKGEKFTKKCNNGNTKDQCPTNKHIFRKGSYLKSKSLEKSKKRKTLEYQFLIYDHENPQIRD